MADNCIQCQQPVTAKQQGIQCDGCFKWNHRTCNTGISQQEYRAAVRAGAKIVWFCPLCPEAESSRISMTESSADILESEEFNPPLRDSFADQSTIYGPQAQPAIEESSEEAMVLLNELGDEPCPALPKPDHLARAANRVRQSTRPRDPSDLDFDLCHEHIPDGFLKADIKNIGKRRHLIFATDQQL